MILWLSKVIWAGAGHYKSISNQMLKLLEGRIRELCTNAANLAAIRLWWWFSLLTHDEMENYFSIIQSYELTPCFPSPITPFSQSIENHWHSLYPGRNYFQKSSLLLFLCDIYPLYETFSAIWRWVSVQGPVPRDRYKKWTKCSLHHDIEDWWKYLLTQQFLIVCRYLYKSTILID